MWRWRNVQPTFRWSVSILMFDGQYLKAGSIYAISCLSWLDKQNCPNFWANIPRSCRWTPTIVKMCLLETKPTRDVESVWFYCWASVFMLVKCVLLIYNVSYTNIKVILFMCLSLWNWTVFKGPRGMTSVLIFSFVRRILSFRSWFHFFSEFSDLMFIFINISKNPDKTQTNYLIGSMEPMSETVGICGTKCCIRCVFVVNVLYSVGTWQYTIWK